MIREEDTGETGGTENFWNKVIKLAFEFQLFYLQISINTTINCGYPLSKFNAN